MDKSAVFAAFVASKTEKINELRRALGGTRQEVNDSPGSNKSHSDTSRFQYSNLALGIEGSLVDSEYALSLAQALHQGSFDRISPGCFFVLKDVVTGEAENYLFIMEGGGDIFEAEGQEIMTISAGAPLMASISGKRRGERAIFRNRYLEVLDVQ